ncbi:aspartate-semialdehyde dehydrogenase [Motiliproteus sediminis]|uniref:aspartate-semialdehyde dehydrogenase n=1 Tax=Motiliproteus sediminis TaxID=1468178 RepID=UPI001AEFC089|nr:aspartate-semialdehyde dehydrogenase [Motiliproteus sediminis]
MADYIDVSERLLSAVKQQDFAGYDPFDSLNSALLKATPFYRSSWIRLAWLQLGKRSPLNFRPLLLVPKMRNPKGVGLFILGMLNDYERTGSAVYLEDAVALGDWLLGQQCDKSLWKHSCWGYHFDWQARAFYVPAGKPNIITTVYVARALQALAEVTHKDRYAEAAIDAAAFIYNHLLTKTDQRTFFAYIPGETAFVHNASLWGAAWVGYVGTAVGNYRYLEVALEVARQSAREQLGDGSWVYGTRSHHQFIDGFHTGYNLEALAMLSQTADITEFNDCIRSGLNYYRDTFILPDGTVKYYDNKVYPLDMHSVSQAVLTLIGVGNSPGDEKIATKVLDRAIDRLYISNKSHFIYQRSKYYSNKINYARWTQAWSYYALSYFNNHRA